MEHRPPILDESHDDVLFWALVIAACLAWVAAGVVLVRLV